MLLLGLYGCTKLWFVLLVHSSEDNACLAKDTKKTACYIRDFT